MIEVVHELRPEHRTNMLFHRLFLFVILIAVTLIASPSAVVAQIRPLNDSAILSKFRTDETVVLFTTTASMNEDGTSWHVPIHGWVYKPERSKFRKAIVSRLLRARYGLRANLQSQKLYDRRINLLFADVKEHRRVVISLAGRRFALPPTGDNGHFRGVVSLSVDDVADEVQDGQLAVTVIMPQGDLRQFTGRVMINSPTGLSIISDIDDTVKLTYVTDHKRLFEQTFFRPFEAAPGMAAFYRKAYKSGVAFHFVSSSPWHLYEPLAEFLVAAGFPPASIHLKLIALTDSSVLNLFKDGTQTKPPQIIALLRAYPKRKFILIGDSGEKDPETYAPLLRKYPNQISKIYIRNVTNARRNDARFAKVFAGISASKWQLFTDPATLLRR